MNDEIRTMDSSPNGDPSVKVDINLAGTQELTTIPGVGPEMARRIIAARPFEELDDLQRVSGIGPAVLERILPYLELHGNNRPEAVILETAEAEMAPEESPLPEVQDLAESEEEAEEIVHELPPPEAEEEAPIALPAPEAAPADLDTEPEEAEEPEPEPVFTKAPPAASPEPVFTKAPPAPQPEAAPLPANLATRGQSFWMAVGMGLLALVLALAIGLGVLASLNGGLEYATPADVAGISRQVDGVQAQAEILQGDLTGLRARVDNLETLGGRVSEIEQATTELQSGLDAAATHLDELQQQANGLNSQVEELQTQSNRVQNFLDGMRNLLNTLFEGEGAQ
jgi:prefoldin subunit 5